MENRRIKRTIEVVGDERFRTFQIKEITEFLEEGIVVATSKPQRRLITPGRLDEEETYYRTNLLTLPTEVSGIASACWNDETYSAHEAFLRDNLQNNTNNNIPA